MLTIKLMAPALHLLWLLQCSLLTPTKICMFCVSFLYIFLVVVLCIFRESAWCQPRTRNSSDLLNRTSPVQHFACASHSTQQTEQNFKMHIRWDRKCSASLAFLMCNLFLQCIDILCPSMYRCHLLY